MAPHEFEVAIQKAVDDKVVAGAVLVAADRPVDEGTCYERTFGHVSLEEGAPEMQLDTLMWVASCTKLMTIVSALQLVARNLLTLDDPLGDLLPEFAPPTPLLVASTDSRSKFILSSTEKPITLRHLITHTSGMGYEFVSTFLTAWRASVSEPGKPPPVRTRNVQKEYLMPLTFEPGADGKWQYSCGLDWVGKVIERVNSGIRLGEYMREHIWGPLGMKSTTFRPLGDPELKKKLISRVWREPNGELKMDPMTTIYPHIEPDDDTGGGGVYTTAGDYVKLLRSLLLDDGKVLSSAMLDELFRPQLPETKELQDTLGALDDAKAQVMCTEISSSKDVKWNWGLGGLVAEEGVQGKAGKGTMWWSGMPNCLWWIDRERGTCGFYGSQLMPYGDERTARLSAGFQKWMYDRTAASR